MTVFVFHANLVPEVTVNNNLNFDKNGNYNGSYADNCNDSSSSSSVSDSAITFLGIGVCTLTFQPTLSQLYAVLGLSFPGLLKPSVLYIWNVSCYRV